MRQVIIRRGRACVDEVPAPVVAPGTVLVSVKSSCISSGTELGGMQSSGSPLWKRALRQPEQVQKAVGMAVTYGPRRTLELINGRLAAGTATGYSAAGVVEEVGAEVTGIDVAQAVACAGAQCAHHAEYISVPRNLLVPVPAGVSLADASTVTLGAIALQGVRRAQPTLGEMFVVYGLGLIGQLTAQLLRANGCRVIGLDLDRARMQLAADLARAHCLHPEDDDAVGQVMRVTGGRGADGVIITAASASDAIVSTAFRMCRRKGRVILVGDVGLNLKRADFYAKEIDFLVSTSYGPGRYDASYEEQGHDYPFGYVRWTENRNMEEYLRLLATGDVQVAPLIQASFPIEKAPDAYEALSSPGKPLVVLLTYPEHAPAPIRRVDNARATARRAGAIRVALIGAGGFAKGMHLPNLQALSSDFHLRAIVSRTGHNASTTVQQWGAEYGSTDADSVIHDPDVDAVIVATRHNLHASLALAALRAGKHVLVEKPMAVTTAELDDFEQWYAQSDGRDRPVLLTGFNRRFSSYMARISETLAGRSNPMILNYRMNAGHLAADHWVHGEEGLGRNIGEACHIYDVFTYLTGSALSTITASAIAPRTEHYRRDDNFVATATFADGSVATLTYTALGHSEYPKERLDVYCDGMVVSLDDYKLLKVVGRKSRDFRTTLPEKGQKEELVAFARAIRGESGWPIPFWQQAQATSMALSVQQLIV